MSTPGICTACNRFVVRLYRLVGTRPKRCFSCTVDHYYRDLLRLEEADVKKPPPRLDSRRGRKQHATPSNAIRDFLRQGGTHKMVDLQAMTWNSGTLTWVTMGASFGTWILGQINASPNIENVGLTATIVGTLAVAAKTSGECFKAWMAYREAELHNGDLKAELAEVEAHHSKRDAIAKTGVCPYVREMEPACYERTANAGMKSLAPKPKVASKRATPRRKPES
jgi:hypothetical protein